MIRQIPNIITLSNLLSGCVGIWFASKNNLDYAAYCILAGAILDVFDGLAARLLNVASSIGKDLDSLADVVTFGVLPGFIVVMTLEKIPSAMTYAFAGFFIPVFSAYRLAKFNNDTRGRTKFYGLPTPAHAIFYAGLPFVLNTPWSYVYTEPKLLIGITLLLSILLVSDVPLLSLKMNFKQGGWLPWAAIALSSILLIIMYGLGAFIPVILLYIASSLVFNIIDNSES